MYWTSVKKVNPTSETVYIVKRLDSQNNLIMSGIFIYKSNHVWVSKNRHRHIQVSDNDWYCTVSSVIHNVEDRLINEFYEEFNRGNI